MPTTLPGQPIDQRTAALALPLPHIDNWLEDDVPRLRAALQSIDAQLLSLQGQLQAQAHASSAALQAAVDKLQRGIDAAASHGAGQMAVHSARLDALARRVRELENAALFGI